MQEQSVQSSVAVEHRQDPMTQRSERVWDLAMKATVPVAIILGAALIRHEVNLAQQAVEIRTINDSRFTDIDGLKMEKSLKQWIEQRFPPGWLRDDIQEIKGRLQKIEDKMK